MSLINKEKLESEMYHNAFEIDTDLQKWDSGCWIRYKMFENVIEEQPEVKAIPIEWLKRYELAKGQEVRLQDAINEWEKENEVG